MSSEHYSPVSEATSRMKPRDPQARWAARADSVRRQVSAKPQGSETVVRSSTSPSTLTSNPNVSVSSEIVADKGCDHITAPAAKSAIDPPPSESSWAQFVQQRSALLDQALKESVITGKFADVELYAYTKRSRVGTVHTPVAVNANARLLKSASPILKGILQDRNKNAGCIPTKYLKHDYDDDSDIEDEGAPASYRTNTEPSAFVVLDSASDYSSTDEDEEDRAISLHSNAVFAPQAAAKTWQALIHFLYTGRIVFLPLRSCQTQSHPAASPSRIACSPKSMYRLASKLQLDELKRLARAKFTVDLYANNIVKEMFTDFTWRHPEVLKVEVDWFCMYSDAEVTRDELKKAIKAATSGQMHQGEVVLVALFEHLLPSIAFS